MQNFIRENLFESVVFKMAAIFRGLSMLMGVMC